MGVKQEVPALLTQAERLFRAELLFDLSEQTHPALLEVWLTD